MPGPTPDYDTVTVIWQRANDDRTAPQGWVYLKYDGGLRVSDGIPVGTKEWKRKVRRTVLVKEGDPHRYVIGEAIFTDVPASNDPDVQGGGGSWTIREELVGTESRTYQFYADADAEDGVVMVGPLGPAEPDPGTVYSVVTVADFTGLTSRVTGLEENPGGGGVGTVLSVNSVEPVEGDVPLTLADLPDVGEALADKADLVDGKVDPEQLPPYPVGERHVAEDQTAMLALDAGLGDICIRLDLNTRWLQRPHPARGLDPTGRLRVGGRARRQG